MQRIDDLRGLRNALSRDDLEAEHPNLWLVRALTEEELPPTYFHTAFSGDEGASLAAIGIPASISELAAFLRVDAERYGCHRVKKSGANPYSDRIIVGRAKNSDIVLRQDSVSKVHAYFKRPGSELRLLDAKSRNGTRVNGAPVPTEGEGVVIESGAQVVFGSVACLVVSSKDLFNVI